MEEAKAQTPEAMDIDPEFVESAIEDPVDENPKQLNPQPPEAKELLQVQQTENQGSVQSQTDDDQEVLVSQPTEDEKLTHYEPPGLASQFEDEEKECKEQPVREEKELEDISIIVDYKRSQEQPQQVSGPQAQELVSSVPSQHSEQKIELNLSENQSLVSLVGSDGPLKVIYEKRRLMIKKMVLENFKSYLGRKEIGPFHKRFTSIIGPNGSGKSNVIDALLFVFGRRATKMRFKKVIELIYSKSDRPDIQHCKVEVFFQEIEDDYDKDDDAYKVLEGTSFKVARIVRKKKDKHGKLKTDKNGDFIGESFYTMNDQKCTSDDVSKKLLPFGLDLDNNRFLILQGEVEKISLMPPKGRANNEMGMLEYLEEIIGSDKFVSGIDECKAKEEAFEQEFTTNLNRLKLKEQERDKLASAKKEAEKYLIDILKKNRYEADIEQAKVHRLKVKKGTVQKRISDMKGEMGEYQELGRTTQARLREMENDYKVRKAEFEKLQNELEKTRDIVAEREKEHTQLGEERKLLKEARKKAQTSLEKLTDKVEKGNTDRKESEETINTHGEEIVTLREKEEKLVKQRQQYMEELAEKTKPIQAEIAVKKQQLIPLRDRENEYSGLVQNLIAQKKKRNDRYFQVKKRRDDTVKKVEDLTKKLQEMEGKHINEVTKIQQITERLQILEREKETGVQKIAEFKKEIHGKSQRLANYKHQKELTTGSRESSRAHLAAQENGQLRGIIGRCGDFGTIDEKYDIAVSTACSHLEHILVEQTTDATNAVKYCEKNNLGFNRYLVLSTVTRNIDPRRMEPIQTPENLPRLFDLIKVRDQRFRPIFYKSVGDTIVANDIRQGNRVCQMLGRKWRVVTLDGCVISADGAMSGGGRPRKGGMSSKPIEVGISDDMLDALKVEIQDLEADRKEYTRKLKAMRKESQKLTGELGKLKRAIEDFNLYKQEHEADIAKFRGLLPKLERKFTEAAKKIEDPEMEANLARAQKYLNTQKGKCQKIDEEIKRMEQQCEDLGGAQLRVCVEEISTTVERLRNLEKELEDHKMLIVTIGKKLVTWTKKIEALKIEITETEKKRAVVKEKQTKAEEFAVEAIKKQDEIRGHLAEKHDAWTAIQEKWDKTESDSRRINQRIVKLKGKLKSVVVEEKNLSDTIAHHIAKLDGMIANIRKDEHDLFICQELDDEDNQEKDVEEQGDAMDIDDEEDEKRDIEKKKVRKGHHERVVPYKKLTDEECESLNESKLKAEIQRLNEEIKKQAPNMQSIDEWKIKEREVSKWSRFLEKIRLKREENREQLAVKVQRRLDKFNQAFNQINRELKTMYRTLTVGGDAELNMVDRLDPFAEGVEFTVRPPKKSWKVISNLSGGEKTLSSMSLVFALHKFKPTPLYVMDEIDAALDYKNVSIVADYIKKCTKNAQFIIISLRSNMFEQANWLTGIYKTHDASKSITVDPKQFQELCLGLS